MKIFTCFVVSIFAQMGSAQEVQNSTSTLSLEPIDSKSPRLALSQPAASLSFTDLMEKRNEYSNLKLSEQNFKLDSKSFEKSTLFILDGQGGYRSYDIYDSWMKQGRNYQHYFELSQTCAAGPAPYQPYDGLDVASVLATGLLSDVFDLPQKWKVGKRFTICIR